MIRKKNAPITIKDIAKALNLAPSSVARALNGSHKISEYTIKKVKDYATKHNYRPNLMAQSLKQKQSRSIGVLLCAIPNNFYAEVLNGIESVASGKDYHVIITQSHESVDKEKKDIRNFQWKGVDGVLASLSAETTHASHFEELIQNGTPVVFFDRVPENINTHKIFVDDTGGSYQLTKHLIKEGFTRISHITSAPQLSITQRRLVGYKKALLENQMKIREEYIKYCLHGGKDDNEVSQAVDQLLNMEKGPDAITTASDRITIKTMALLRNKGIRVPQQIGFGGFSNFSAPELFSPSLTTVIQPAFEMGKQAAELLLQLIESKREVNQFTTVTLPTELKIRNSSLKKHHIGNH